MTVVVPKMTSSEGSSFAQKGGRGGRGGKGQGTITFNEEYWKDKTCFNCGEKGHPSSSCMKEACQGNQELEESIQPTSEDNRMRLGLV
jgi:hypothetical protein